MNSIVVPVDFSPVSLNDVHYATNLAKAMKADLVLLNTYTLPLTFTEVPVTSVTVDELATISGERLEVLKSSLEHITSSELKIYTETRLGELIETVDELCEKLRPLALVMGTEGHGQVHDLFIGGNTVNVMQKISIPVIVVPMGVVFKIPKKVGVACDLSEVVDTLPTAGIINILSWFDSILLVINVHSKNSMIGDPQHSESLMLDSLLSELKPTYSFLEGGDVSGTIMQYAEENEIDWILVVPKKHRRLSVIMHKSISKEIAYKTHIPLIGIHS